MSLPPGATRVFDEHHDRILALFQKLRYSPENLPSVVEELVRRLNAHFEEEEGLMRALRFRGREAHEAEHRAMTTLFDEGLGTELQAAGDHDAVLAAVQRYEQIFVDHIHGLDHELAREVARKTKAAPGGTSAGRTAKAKR